MNRLPISICMVSGAEAQRIGRALESVAAWATEIIVVLNSEVSDGTDEIATRHGAQVFREPWKGFVGQKNSAAEKATQPWLFNLDADEMVSPALAEELSRIFDTRSRSGGAEAQISTAREDGKEKLEPAKELRRPEGEDGPLSPTLSPSEGEREKTGLVGGPHATRNADFDSAHAGCYAAYEFPRCSFYCGRWIRHGDWYPDRVLRLWLRDKGRWVGDEPHARLEITGRVGRLRSDLL